MVRTWMGKKSECKCFRDRIRQPERHTEKKRTREIHNEIQIKMRKLRDPRRARGRDR